MSPRRSGRPLGAVAALVVAGALWTCDAAAQSRLEVTASGGRWSGYELGQRRPTITGPQAPTGSPVTYFDADIDVEPGAAAELRIGWRLFGRVYAEATGGLAGNDVQVRISEDIEQAPAATISSRVTQITIEGGALIEIATLRALGGDLVPFVAGGGGYLRQVHEDRVLIETGETVYGGAGVKWRSSAATPKGWRQRFVLRGDVRIVSRSGGADIEASRRGYITVSGGVGLRFF
jgi:hypothetical protein